MRVGLFGGSFDPPHAGHLAVAKAALVLGGMDLVLLAPVGRQPLKPEGALAGFADRLKMVELLCAGEGRLQASAIDAPYEDDASAPNYTIDTLRRMRGTLQAGDEVSIIVGIDAFVELRGWREWEGIFGLARWLVVSRPGFDVGHLAEMGLDEAQMERISWLDGVWEDVSATEIRELLRSGADCSGLLTPAVFRYIQERGLYHRDTRGF